MADGYADLRTVERIMRSAAMKDLIAQARRTPVARTVHPAVYQLLNGPDIPNPEDGVQMDLETLWSTR